ncbi:hypothetical protein KZX46_11040 [Polymorphobacter sp. PAMC 29334]|uniref:hypothetical protein n=1 Tax=Polymorphobacter sp. PAMC 29334 TaxID=2862331 RepID=UPI001C74954A|nr:hypothetical protein [Polymorphobacter sp. PAMC 29334]QYE36403.1 hypothetical protein KZX46_11040 [Polymorphobacter sp. PAMC 29334]
MSLKRWLQSFAAARPAIHNRPGPVPTMLPPIDGTNPIHRLLDESGLPWREPRRLVEARGISKDPAYQRDAMLFADAARPEGFMQPWWARVFERYAPDMPMVCFNGLVWFADDAAINIHRAADFFAARLGPAVVGQQYNTLVCRWQAGTASLQLQSWPPAWQSPALTNAAYVRDPRLATACSVTLLTGFRLPLSPTEERWVADFRPIAEIRRFETAMSGELRETAPRETEVEYAREPGDYLATVQNQVGVPPDRAALILCTHQLFVVPVGDVVGFEVLRSLPAKGGGGSTLWVHCRTTCPGVAYKRLHVAEHDKPDGIGPLGQKLAAIFGKPCEISPYFDDV